MAFSHLHLHSEFSLLDGAIRVDDLVEKAKELGQTSVAITDHGVLSNAVKFVTAAKDVGIKPILGMETYLASNGDHKTPAKTGGDNFHLTLLAKNKAGYANLMRLTSLGHIEGLSYKPRVDRELLRAHSEGIIVLSGCIGAEIPQSIIERGEQAGLKLAREYQRIFGDDFYIEVMNHGKTNGVDHVRVERSGRTDYSESDLNMALVGIADVLGIGVIATNDAHYLQREHGPYHDALLCIGTGSWLDKPDRLRFPGAEHKAWEFYVKSESDMLACNADGWWGTACANTAILADSIEGDVVPLGMNVQPKFKIPNDPEFVAWKTKPSPE